MPEERISRGGRIIDGPLKDLELNKYKTSDTLVYPLSLRGDTDNKHYLKFNINIPERSKYLSSGGGSGGGAGVTQDSRTASAGSDEQVLGSNADPLGLAAGAAALFTGAFNAISGGGLPAALQKGNAAAAAGAAFKALLGGGIAAGVISFVDMTRKTKTLKQQIYLYVPDTVQQSTTNKWSAVSLTAALGIAGLAAQGGDAAAAAIGNMMKADTSDVKLTSGKTASGASAVAAEVAGKAAEASGLFGGDIGKVVLASAGYAQNPQIEILFDTVDNRRFQFDFKFSPKSQEEAKEVLEIIKAFRFHAAPELIGGAGSGRYFVPPSEFDISYMFGGSVNGALHRFATCVLEGIDVNYSNGNFASYDDGMPVEIGLTLKFLEIEILHKKLISEGY